uniref:Uncharacterized protein H25N7.05 n=1 Tax=Trypanosoma brucei TaxID=5691 RepID=Q8WPT2_9TRYP|nr:hypothetical protein [Trypanosoma brucei]
MRDTTLSIRLMVAVSGGADSRIRRIVFAFNKTVCLSWSNKTPINSYRVTIFCCLETVTPHSFMFLAMWSPHSFTVLCGPLIRMLSIHACTLYSLGAAYCAFTTSESPANTLVMCVKFHGCIY